MIKCLYVGIAQLMVRIYNVSISSFLDYQRKNDLHYPWKIELMVKNKIKRELIFRPLLILNVLTQVLFLKAHRFGL